MLYSVDTEDEENCSDTQLRSNMLPSSPNSPGASLHQTHGFLPPSVHFGPPSAMLKTSGNALTLLLTGPHSNLSGTNTTSSSCPPKKSTTPASYLQPPTTPNVFGKQSTNSFTANPLTTTHHFSWNFTCRQLCFFFHQQNIQTPPFSH